MASLENGGSPMSLPRYAFIAPSLDAPAVEALREQLLGLADAYLRAGLECDLSRVGFLDASALSLFVALDKKLRARGGRLTIRGVHPWLMELFAVTHLDKVLDIRPRAESCPVPQVAVGLLPQGSLPRPLSDGA
jgi:anti-anti-sigma factor